MKKIMVICTEKTGVLARQLFEEVLGSLRSQGLDEIVVVHNRNAAQNIAGVTNLLFEKT